MPEQLVQKLNRPLAVAAVAQLGRAGEEGADGGIGVKAARDGLGVRGLGFHQQVMGVRERVHEFGRAGVNERRERPPSCFSAFRPSCRRFSCSISGRSCRTSMTKPTAMTASTASAFPISPIRPEPPVPRRKYGF